MSGKKGKKKSFYEHNELTRHKMRFYHNNENKYRLRASDRGRSIGTERGKGKTKGSHK